MKVRSLYSLIPLLMTSPLYAAESSGDDDTMVVSASRTGAEQKTLRRRLPSSRKSR
ncbi:hypothetical protein SODG_004870 [Sodalis praecaptivus]